MNLQFCLRQERRKSILDHRGQAPAGGERFSYSSRRIDGQDLRWLKFVEAIRFVVARNIYFPSEPIRKDTSSELVMTVEKSGLFDVAGLRNRENLHESLRLWLSRRKISTDRRLGAVVGFDKVIPELSRTLNLRVLEILASRCPLKGPTMQDSQ